jgi:hypothetical protein
MIELVLIGIVGGLGGFMVGYWINPALKPLKEQVHYWQGMYSTVSKRLKEYEQAEEEPIDQISQLLNHPLAKLLLPKIAERLGISMEDIEGFLGSANLKQGKQLQRDIYQEWK